jgi:hypothetical protein
MKNHNLILFANFIFYKSFFFKDFIEYRKKCQTELNYVIDVMPKTDESKKYETKEPEYLNNMYKESGRFETRLPLLSLFTIRSPNTKLFLSPVVNHRQVSIDNYKSMDAKSGKTLAEYVISEDDTSFSGRDVGLYPYYLDACESHYVGTHMYTGVPLQSACSLNLRLHNKEWANVTVQMKGMYAYNVNERVFSRTMLVLNKPRVWNQENKKRTRNWTDMLHYREELNSNETLERYLESCQLDLPFIQMEQDFEENMRLLQEFFSLLGIVSLAIPEGQHRMLLTCRCVYGYSLFSPAPLIPIQPDTMELSMLYGPEILARLKPRSPIHDSMRAFFILNKDAKAKSIDSSALKKISGALQEQANKEIETSYLSFWKSCYGDILDQL